MLGDGLNSLIPPHQDSENEFDSAQVPQNDQVGEDGGYPLHPGGPDPAPQVAESAARVVNPVPQVAGAGAAPHVPSDAPAAVPFMEEQVFRSAFLSSKPVAQPVSEPRPAFGEGYARPALRGRPPAIGPIQPKPQIFRTAEKQKKPAEESIFHIEVSKIKSNPNQPRRKFAEQGIRELAYSVREFGFLQPLVVSKVEKETAQGVEVEYQLIAGERRLLAAKMLGLPTVPAIVRAVDFEREKLELAVIENIQREDLSPIETARAFARLQEEFRMTQREIASKLGKSREVVGNAVRLLDLPLYIQEALEKGEISESHSRLLLAITDPGAQRKLFDDILGSSLTTRELRDRVQVLKPRRHKGGAEETSPELKMLEEKLSAELGTPVKIERGLNTGKITITFFSEEELESIVRKIGKEAEF